MFPKPNKGPDEVAAWYDAEYAEKQGERAPTIREALMRLRAAKGVLIVETGCANREDGWEEDGLATVVFCEYGRSFSAAVLSIDIDPDAVAMCMMMLTVDGKAPAHVGVRCGDSVDELPALAHRIDLLYLDSLDGTAAMKHVLKEYRGAKAWLGDGSLVLIDDVDKGRANLVLPVMLADGWRVVMQTAKQVLLTRGNDEDSQAAG
jgi:hypothetical protein